MYLYQEVFVGSVCTKMFHIVTVPAPFIIIIHFIRANTIEAENISGWREEFGKLHNVLYIHCIKVIVWSYQFHRVLDQLNIYI